MLLSPSSVLRLLLLVPSTSTTAATASTVRAIFALVPLPTTVVAYPSHLLPVGVERWGLTGLLNSHRGEEKLPKHNTGAATWKVAKVAAFVADVIPVEANVTAALLAHLVVHTLADRLSMVHVHLHVLSPAFWT